MFFFLEFYTFFYEQIVFYYIKQSQYFKSIFQSKFNEANSDLTYK